MQAQEKLSVKVHIAGRMFPLMVIPEEEAAVRNAAKEINERLSELRTQFTGLDEAHLLSMVMLDIATRLELLKEQISGTEHHLSRTIDTLDQDIAHLLGNSVSMSQHPA
jgi:cell division protein ZapA (FtsZ GTPase activity inhibitor)